MFKRKCPKCGKKDIGVVKESVAADFKRNLLNVAIPIRIFTASGRKPKEQYVCRDCSFSWSQP